MNKLGLVITSLLLISSPLRAATVDGNLVLKHCKTALQFTDRVLSNTDPGDSTGVGFCVGMLEGVTYTMTLLSDGAICPPGGGMKNMEVLKIVVRYLENHPADLHIDGAFLVNMALFDAYPCN